MNRRSFMNGAAAAVAACTAKPVLGKSYLQRIIEEYGDASGATFTGPIITSTPWTFVRRWPEFISVIITDDIPHDTVLGSPPNRAGDWIGEGPWPSDRTLK